GMEGYYYKPRIDLEILKKHSEGIICLSGCMRGEIAKTVVSRSENETDKVLQKYLDIFGKDNLYIEIQRSSLQRDSKEETLITKLVELARRHDLKIVATADCHYLRPEDSEAQDVLVCIGTARTITDSERMDMRPYDLSLKSTEEMYERFADYPEAVENSAEVADKCNLEILVNQRYFPKVEVPAGKTSAQYLLELTYTRAQEKYGQNGVIPENVKARVDYELNIINKKSFDTYFLMVADIVEGAHTLGAITNTRGSAAGSIVGYVLGITNVDPLEFAIPFERFLTEHRPTPPDIDLDIADNRRDEAIAYTTNKYGKDKVAQIITFGKMMARAAVRDVGRALGVAYAKCDAIAKMIPMGKQGFEMTLEKALGMNPELKEVYEKDPETRRILDIAKKLEGGARHASIHAAGIIITPTELTDYMPLQFEPDGNRIITQYDMYALDVNASNNAIGVIKMDLLGIRNLSILEAAVRIAEARHNVKIDINNLPHPDPKTFKLLSEGHTFGVFQLGSSGMTRYLMELKPSTIFDIMAMIALYRPGPMQFIPEYIARKHSPKLIKYFDPAFEKILDRTYGILVYQDDLLTIAHDLAGYSWEEVDKFRKAVGKKIPAEMAKQKAKFIKGCMQTSSWSEEKATDIWSWIEPFAAYGFNKGHSASYCVVSYQTAYMKANYTVEFMAAVLTAESGNMDTVVDAIEECKIMSIEVLAPDLNESLADFTVIDEKHIRFGLNAIKNLGSDVIEKIISLRKSGGKFKNLEDFINRIKSRNFNKKSWESLVKSGALDSIGERGQLLGNSEMILEFARSLFKLAEDKQHSLFGDAQLPQAKLKLRDVEPAAKKDMIAWEKELLGLFVTAHPMDDVQEHINKIARPIKTLKDARSTELTIGGVVTRVQKIVTKKGDPMWFVDVEDKTGMIEVLIFPKVLQQFGPLLESDKILLFHGKVSDKDGVPKFLAELIEEFQMGMIPQPVQSNRNFNTAPTIPMQTPTAVPDQIPAVTIKIPANISQDIFVELKNLFEQYPGNHNVNLVINEQKIKTPFKISMNDELKGKIKSLIS
ncbi:MAG: DNA polymerase III subunit alpha, partial [Candidatus Doudnabacteria bacterium]|nr:DNA polymerase III subunit alpha [Candidatus Doudnabacteria bacterium]